MSSGLISHMMGFPRFCHGLPAAHFQTTLVSLFTGMCPFGGSPHCSNTDGVLRRLSFPCFSLVFVSFLPLRLCITFGCKVGKPGMRQKPSKNDENACTVKPHPGGQGPLVGAPKSGKAHRFVTLASNCFPLSSQQCKLQAVGVPPPTACRAVLKL